MTKTSKRPTDRHPSKGMAGGFFILVALIIGSIIGIIYNEPSMGMVGGLATGIAIAVAIWLIDRRRA
jgi:hypothetical protein